MSKIRDEIRKAIRDSDTTRYRLSKETGVSESHLSRFMSEERGVSLENIESLADALGLEIIIRSKKGRKKVKHSKSR